MAQRQAVEQKDLVTRDGGNATREFCFTLTPGTFPRAGPPTALWIHKGQRRFLDEATTQLPGGIALSNRGRVMRRAACQAAQ